MRLADYIAVLQQLQAQHGPDLEVEKFIPAKGRHEAPAPVLAYRRAFRTHKTLANHPMGVPAFFHPEHDNIVQRGDPVIRV